MIPSRHAEDRRAIRLLVFLACMTVLATPVPCAAQEFFVPEPIQRRMLAGNEPLAFDVYTLGPALHDLRVVPTELQDPDGKAIGASFAITGNPQVDAQHPSHITITPRDPKLFERLGDYRLTFRIEGKVGTDAAEKAIQVPKTAIFSRIKPAVTVLGIRDRAIRLTRPAPLFSASRSDVPITIRNATSTKQRVTITADPIATSGESSADVEGSISTITQDFPPGDTAIKLTIATSESGALQSRLRVNIAGHPEIEDIPFKLIVSDAAFVPLLAIFFGVLAAFLLNYFATRRRPEEANRFRALLLQQRLERLRFRTVDRRLQIDRMLGELQDLALTNGAGFATEVGTKLESMRQAIDVLEKEVEADRQAVQQKIRDVRASIDAMRATADPGKLEAAVKELSRLETLAAQNRHAEAIAALTTLADTVGRLVPPPDTTRDGRPDEEFAPEPARPPVSSLSVVSRPAGRIAGREIVFEVTANVAKDEALHWDFGDGATETQPRRARHTYERAGNFEVIVELPDGTLGTANIDVEQSDVERAAKDATKRLVQIDLLLSAFALIVATATGLLMLYAGKTFGSLTNYLEAFLWGFGIDGSVRGFGNVLKKLMSNG
jgi:hypothetical protein